MDRLQVNVRLEQELIEALDRKRIEMQPELGKIPTRSDVMRLALEAFLTLSPSRGEGPGSRRSKSGTKK